MQMLATGATYSIEESRAIIDRSHETVVFEPGDTARWDEQLKIFEQYLRDEVCLRQPK